MVDGDNEPTWGADSIATPNPAPHSDYHRQAAQHFEENPAPGPYQVPAASPTAQTSFPVITPQISLPVQPPVAPASVSQPVAPTTYTPPTIVPPSPAPGAAYPQVPLSYQAAGYPQAPLKDTFVTRLVEKGVRGELLRQPWFHQLRATQPDVVVFVSFAVAFVLTGMFRLIGSNFVSDLLAIGLWAGVAYVYFALGTRLSHQFLLWGVCVAGGVSMLFRVILLLMGGRTMFWFHGWGDPLPVYILNVLLDIAVAALLGYVGIQMQREIAKLSRP